MAAPHVAGVIALMFQRNRTLDAATIRTALTSTARNPTGLALPNFDWGFGRVDASAAVGAVPVPPGLMQDAHVPAPASLGIRPGAMPPSSLLQRLQRVQELVLPFPAGHLWAAIVSRHFDEVLRLVNTNRRVAAAWHRNGGPAMVRAALSLLESEPTRLVIPVAVGDSPLTAQLDVIFESWRRYGSPRSGRRHRSVPRRRLWRCRASRCTRSSPTAPRCPDHGFIRPMLALAMSKAGTLELIARELGDVLAPLEQRLAGGGALALLGAVGVRLPDSVATHAQVVTAINDAIANAAALAPMVAQLAAAIAADDEAQIVSTGIAVVDAARAVHRGLWQPVAGAADRRGGPYPGGARGAAAAHRRHSPSPLRLPRRRVPRATVDGGCAGAHARRPYRPRRRARRSDQPLAPAVSRDARCGSIAWATCCRARSSISRPSTGSAPRTSTAALFVGSRIPRGLRLPGGADRAARAPPILEAYLVSLEACRRPRRRSVSSSASRRPRTSNGRSTCRDPWSIPARCEGALRCGHGRHHHAAVRCAAHAARRGRLARAHGRPRRRGWRHSRWCCSGSRRHRLEATKVAAGFGFKATADGARANGEPVVRAEVKGGKLVIDHVEGRDGFIQTILSGFEVDSTFELGAAGRRATGSVSRAAPASSWSCRCT